MFRTFLRLVLCLGIVAMPAEAAELDLCAHRSERSSRLAALSGPGRTPLQQTPPEAQLAAASGAGRAHRLSNRAGWRAKRPG